MFKIFIVLSLFLLSGCNEEALDRAKIIDKMNPEQMRETLYICSYNVYKCEPAINHLGYIK